MRIRLGLAVLLVFASPAFADVIELKTGQRVEGTFKAGTTASISVEVAGQTLTIEIDKVRAIYFGAAPAPVAQQPSARDEAMKALRGLRSAAQGGVGYRDYAPRVTDAKIIVDRYLQGPGEPESPGKASIKEALGFYVFASSVWNAKVSSTGYESIGADPIIRRCPAAVQVLEQTTLQRGGLSNAHFNGIILSFGGVPPLWSCASDKLAEAEKLLGGTK